EDGVPLPGVNITVEGTTRGTQTDFDGNYTIEANQGDILVFSFVGFEDQIMSIGDDTVMNATMREGSSLDEVIVIGYGTTRKEDLSTSVSSVKMDDAVKSGQA